MKGPDEVSSVRLRWPGPYTPGHLFYIHYWIWAPQKGEVTSIAKAILVGAHNIPNSWGSESFTKRRARWSVPHAEYSQLSTLPKYSAPPLAFKILYLGSLGLHDLNLDVILMLHSL